MSRYEMKLTIYIHVSCLDYNWNIMVTETNFEVCYLCHMWPLMQMYPNECPLKWPKTIHLPFVCYLFMIDRMPLKWIGSSVQKNFQLFKYYSYPLEKIFISSNRWGYPFKRKKNHLFKLLRLFVRIRTAKVKHSKKLMICSNNWGYPFN